MPLPLGARLGPYEILAPLGAGGMGEVYRARDSKLNRDVAIKILPSALAGDTDYLTRFQREAQVLASLNHPNIAAIYGLEGQAIVMELVEGETLKGPLPLPEALNIARQIAEALEAAHDKGIIHRDLKPGNIKLTPDGVVKVLDFGLAKAVEHNSRSGADSPTLTMRATEAGPILGTAGYMSPEQAAGKPVDRRADIWSFGVVLYELLTGTRLFEGETVSHTLADVLRADIDLTKVPEGPIRELIRRCLDRNIKNRLSHIGEARYIIDHHQAQPAKATRHQPSRWPWAISALLAAGLIGLAALHFSSSPAEQPVVRFQFSMPEKASFGASQGMAFSPDGKRIVFGALSENGRSQLWLRALDSLSAQPLPETDGALSPFWSPDSRHIGFFVTGSLKRIDVSGGTPQTVCSLDAVGTGGSWSKDGVIAFATNINALFRVPQAGGVATPLTRLNGARSEFRHARPWFLPDGKRFLYLAVSRDVDSTGIYLGSLDGGEGKRLLKSNQGAAYVPPAPGAQNGHLLFLSGRNLVAQPVNPGDLSLSGDATPVAEGVSASISLPHFSVSANGVLLFRRGEDTTRKIAWFDRKGAPIEDLGPVTADYNTLSLSRDDTRVAVTRTDFVGGSTLWLMDIPRGVPIRFTFDRAQESFPVWSPSGDRIVYSSRKNAAAQDLYIKDSSGGSGDRLLLQSSSNKDASDWSLDGRFLLYSDDAKGNSDLWLLADPGARAGDRTPRPFLTTPFNERQGQFFPSMGDAPNWVAYTSDESGRLEVFVQGMTASGAAGGGKYQISTAGGSQPTWKRDGKELYYLDPNNVLMSVDVKTTPRFEHGTAKPLFQMKARPVGLNNRNYSPSADGQRFLMVVDREETGTYPITVVFNWPAGLKR